jgi:hypothetical protein
MARSSSRQWWRKAVRLWDGLFSLGDRGVRSSKLLLRDALGFLRRLPAVPNRRRSPVRLEFVPLPEMFAALAA